VKHGAIPCVTAAPTITASPTGTSTECGSSARFNVSVKNNDSGSCASQTIGLGATAPTGWTSTFGASSCTTDYPEAQAPAITLTATAGSRSTFTGWSGACSGTATTCTVSMNSDKSVTATFGKSSGGKPKR